ncbi:NPCBM/NEW2 domain-containing protein [Catellatospora tritici]|uniref:NPCBM/NEW2 domain-containing protein n=1 Tax=Catellatospora tritici TaxID=2851566 RepID=UPI001C2DCA02|nr:NPCBM/NEW2 domain-containing protein [Catellatospora tritici]MBV1855103.1 NPCBM/NEW2 domain-containing protein [Catellatospora tritici]
MFNADDNGGWLGQRSVAFWTVVAGIAALVTLCISPFRFGDGDNAPSGVSETAGVSPNQSVPAGRPSDTEPSPPASATGGAYLADLPIVGGCCGGRAAVTLSGVEYPTSFVINTGYSRLDGSDAEFNLGGKGSRLIAMVGVDDSENARGIKVDLTFYGDDRTLKAVTVSLTHPVKVNINVSGVIRLRVFLKPRQTVFDGRDFFVSLGDARVEGA